MGDIYLKIYVENGDTIVFEGQGTDDRPGYFPTRWDDTAKRFGTVVSGKGHISITSEAKAAFRRIVQEARHTGDDLSCLDIHSCRGNSEGEKDVCLSYLGEVVTRWNIEDVIHDEKFFIGTGEGFPEIELLDKLVAVD